MPDAVAPNQFTLNHDPDLTTLDLGETYEPGVDDRSYWGLNRYDNANREYLLYYPREWPGHKDRRPHWWMSRIQLDLPINHYLRCLNKVPQPTNDRDEEECWTVFLDLVVPTHGGARTGSVLKEYERIMKLRADHRTWGPADILLMHIANALTLKPKGRPTGPPSETPIEIFDGRQVNTNEDLQLRVSDSHFFLFTLFEIIRVRVFSSFPLTAQKAYGILVAFAPNSAYLRTQPIPNDEFGNPVQVPKILRTYKTDTNNTQEFSNYIVMRCAKCDGTNPLLCCFISTGNSRTGKCLRCKSQPCTFVPISGAALARINIAKLAGAALRDTPEGREQYVAAMEQATNQIG